MILSEKPIPAYKKGYSLFAASHLPEKVTVFGIGQRTQDIFNADVLNEILGKTVITRSFEEIAGKDIRRIHQVPLDFSEDERAVYLLAMEEFHRMREIYFNSTGNSRKDAMMRLIQQITLLLRISAAPSTMQEFTGDHVVKIDKILGMIGEWQNEIVAIGVRHKNVLGEYKAALEACLQFGRYGQDESSSSPICVNANTVPMPAVTGNALKKNRLTRGTVCVF